MTDIPVYSYEDLRKKADEFLLKYNPAGDIPVPIEEIVEFEFKINIVHVDVYGIFDYPFSSVVEVLKVPANWCDIVSLHPNVKACTYRAQLFDLNKKDYLTFKTKEHMDQVMLQRQTATGLQ